MKDRQRQNVQVKAVTLASSKGEPLSDELLDTINGAAVVTGIDQPIKQAFVSGQTDAELLNETNSKKRINYA